MNRISRVPVLTSAVLAGILALPVSLAHAERKTPLEGQPAVRNRLLLVKDRVEVTAAFESSINADFRHTAGGGLKLEYHLSDMLSIGGIGILGTSWNNGMTDRILDTLPGSVPDGDPTPTQAQFDEHLNSIPFHGAAYVGVTPWYGKLAAFGKFFVNFDFYFQGGVSMAQLSNTCCSFPTDPHPGGDPEMGIFPDNNPNNDPALNDGFRMGLYFAGGLHVFLNDWIALDLAVRNYMFSDNPSGLDFDGDLAVTKDDNRFLSHWFGGVGLSFFLPTTTKRTR